MYVHIFPGACPHGEFSDHEMLQELNTICPVIEHLVLCETFDGGNDHIIHSRTLRWLDLWFGEGLYVYGVPSLAEWETDYARKAIINAKNEVPAL